ncbi:hypothetical protein BJY52DRAFT_1270186 [Lactarius psammicola]|nr:hypothetical protein BJY52DRAFT_1270186 [Lactarius psammicola]
MAVLSLPLSFSNSFWTQDYRKGLEVLYDKLEQGASENTEIIAFIRARAQAEDDIGVALASTTKTASGTAFGADDGATLLMAFRGLQAETAQQGGVHQAIARELHELVADPFEKWAKDYHERTQASRATVIDGYVKKYELTQAEVIKLKNTYLSKVRKADEAEEDAKFAPNSELTDKYTTSPRLHPRERPVRTSTISERIAQKFKDIQRKASDLAEGAPSEDKSQVIFSDDKEGPRVDKGKGKAVEEPSGSIVSASPPPLSPQLPPTGLGIKTSAPPEPSEPMLLAGLSLPPAAVSDLLSRASTELKLQSISFPFVGEYQCFTGEDFAAWLNVNVQGFGGSFERAEEAARELTERDGLLRRIGDIGNAFEPLDDAFYLFRPKAFELGKQGVSHSPTKLTPVAGNLIKRSNNFLNVVSKALAANPNTEPPLVRTRLDADAADREYRIAVRKLDRQRLGLEERIEDTLKLLQRWETERLYAVKAAPLERSASHIAAYLPDSDLSALIERYRTGPFRPQPQVYESVAHDESDVLFGIDLRRWSEGGWSTLHGEAQDKPQIPPVLTALLDGLQLAYPKLSNDDERRKAWIYEVPLTAVHHLRESLNAVHPEQPIPADIMTNYDPPVLASAVKLWLLELDPPIALWEGWEDLRRLYPNVGSTTKAEKASTDEHEHLEALKMALLRLPKIHLYVLDALVVHLKTLIENTDVEETDEVYVTKLALSIGRTILRPKFETGVSVQDRHPTAFFVDLVKHHGDVLPPTIAKKKADTERKVPLRKRTAPIDMRMSRTRLSAGADAKDWLVKERAQGNIPPPVPPVSSISRAPEPAPVPTPAPPPPPAVQPIPPPPPLKPTLAPVPPRVVAPIPVPAAPAVNPDLPARPAFKSPPPEDDDVPPRPAFTSPPPDSDRESPVPSPVPAPAPAPVPAAAPVKVSPPTPGRRNSGSPRPGPMRTSSPRVRSPSNSSSPLAGGAGLRSPSPAVSQSEDAPLNPTRASLSRTTSTEASRARQPRGSRPPRGGNVSSIVSSMNRSSVASDPRTSPPPSAGLQRAGRGRPQSGIVDEKRRSLTGLARRTMDSDAEEGVVG